MDETSKFHEGTIVPVRELLDLGGVLYYAWVVPAMACLAVFAILYFRFTLALESRTQRLFVLAATLYVGGAVGIEMVSAAHKYSMEYQDLTYDLLGVLEEALEMVGQVVFLYALMDFIRSRWSNISIRLGA